MHLKRLHFNSTRDYLAWYAERDPARYPLSRHHAQDGALGARQMRDGTDEYNAEIEKIANVIWENIPTLQRTWRLDVAGVFPSVPAYLAGEPEDMYRQVEDYNEHTPIRIWIGLTSSYGVGHQELIKRGAALAAFAQALSEVRPVSLTPYVLLGGHLLYGARCGALISWDLTTSPTIMSDVAPNLISPYVIRYMGLDACYTLEPGCDGSWLRGYDNEENMRDMLGAQKEDIYLGSIHLYDPLLVDPVKWIKEHLAQYTADEAA